MEKIKVIIFGTGEISQIAHHYLQEDERYEVCGFTMDNEFIEEKKFKNLSIIPFHLIEQKFPADKFKLFIPLSYAQVNKLREKKFIEARNKGYDFISYIHPKANISSNANIGKNCFIFEDNTIQHDGVFMGIKESNGTLGVDHINLRNYYNYSNSTKEVFGNTGGLMMTRKTIFENNNMFNENYISCFEDVEYNLILNSIGLKNYICGECVAYHYESKTRNCFASDQSD